MGKGEALFRNGEGRKVAGSVRVLLCKVSKYVW